MDESTGEQSAREGGGESHRTRENSSTFPLGHREERPSSGPQWARLHRPPQPAHRQHYENIEHDEHAGLGGGGGNLVNLQKTGQISKIATIINTMRAAKGVPMIIYVFNCGVTLSFVTIITLRINDSQG